MSFPSTMTVPLVGRSSRFMHRTRVLLPAPERPMMPKISPWRMSRLMSSRAWTAPSPWPKVLVRFRIWMMDSLTVSKLLSKMGTEAENKKALEADASRTSAYAPWYHLDSRVSSRRRPLEVPSHFCAVTGAPVVTYACAVGHATPRPCSPGPSAPRSHHRRLSVPYLPGYSSLHRLCIVWRSVAFQFTRRCLSCQRVFSPRKRSKLQLDSG